MITRWKNGVPNTINNLRDVPLNLRLDIGTKPFQNPSLSHRNAVAKLKTRIYTCMPAHDATRAAPGATSWWPVPGPHEVTRPAPVSPRQAPGADRHILVLLHVLKAILNRYTFMLIISLFFNVKYEINYVPKKKVWD
jgi:hypothetical protein